jgi:putative transposase
MASRNTLKVDVEESYYHVYARGVNKELLFRDAADFERFIFLLRAFLSSEVLKNSAGIPYEKLTDKVELLSYCLMPNHFHLLVYQIEKRGMERLMRGVMTGYSMYFNAKYHRRGPVFESRYKAALIAEDTYLLHISRYIHLNPKEWRNYLYSSLCFFRDANEPEWLKSERVLELFPSRKAYMEFVADYEAVKEQLDTIKSLLADGDDVYEFRG